MFINTTCVPYTAGMSRAWQGCHVTALKPLFAPPPDCNPTCFKNRLYQHHCPCGSRYTCHSTYATALPAIDMCFSELLLLSVVMSSSSLRMPLHVWLTATILTQKSSCTRCTTTT
jgi:hypothetical protein